MSAIDDLLIDDMNRGGSECICHRASPDDAVVYSDRDGKQLFYLHKECPIHGIGRIFPKHINQQQEGKANH